MINLDSVPAPSGEEIKTVIHELNIRPILLQDRVIAKLLRHGLELSRYVVSDDDNHTYVGDNSLLEAGPLADAVTFFEELRGLVCPRT